MSQTDARGRKRSAGAPATDAKVDTSAGRRGRVPAQRGAKGAGGAKPAGAPAATAAPAAVEERRVPPRGMDDTGTDLMLYVPPPYLNIGPPIPPKSGRGGLIGVVALIVVLALVSVAATVGYFVKSNAYDRQSAQLADQRAQVASQQSAADQQQTAANAQDARIAELTTQLQAANDQLTSLRHNATTDATKLGNLAKAQAALAACIAADKSWIYLLRIKAGATSLSNAQKKANTACTAANKYLP